MKPEHHFEVIIIGGSFAGLSAALALGRSLRRTLIIDGGQPCNQPTPHSHNFLTQDGEPPEVIAKRAKKQILRYDTVQFKSGMVTDARKERGRFTIGMEGQIEFTAEKVLFATGVKDQMPDIKGFVECWGKTILHCPYCHGYEVRHQKTGILAKGETAFEFCKLIQHWTDQLTLFTNGESGLNPDQKELIRKLNIEIVEKEVAELQHEKGKIQRILFEDGDPFELEAMYSRVDFEQHCDLPVKLGCEMTEQGHVQVDFMQKTSIKGMFAAGDNTTPFRSVSLAVSSGTIAGAAINMELIAQELPQ